MLMGEWVGWRWMRAAFRLSATAVVTSAFFALWILGMLVVGWHRNTAVRWRSFHFRNWSRVLLRLLRIEVVDSGESPEPPFLLVSNHLSYIDIPVLASRVDAFFVAKSEIAHWPVVGTLCRAMGTIFVDRESRRDVVRVLSELDQRLTEGHGVVLFPEGTSTDGSHVRRFLPSLLDAAARLERPVTCASVRYETPPGEEPASEAVCWWGGMTFGPHVWAMMALPGFRAHLSFGDEKILHRDRKELAIRSRAAVVGLLPTLDATSSCR